MACVVCNPYCGKCKPPKQKPVKCPACGKYNFLDLMEDTKCIRCRADLPIPPKPAIVKCLYSGLMCANPCKKHTKAYKDGSFMPCSNNTPPKD